MTFEGRTALVTGAAGASPFLGERTFGERFRFHGSCRQGKGWLTRLVCRTALKCPFLGFCRTTSVV